MRVLVKLIPVHVNILIAFQTYPIYVWLASCAIDTYMARRDGNSCYFGSGFWSMEPLPLPAIEVSCVHVYQMFVVID